MKTILVVAYLSLYGVPSINTYFRSDMRECRREATRIFNNVRAGTARVWCAKTIGETK